MQPVAPQALGALHRVVDRADRPGRREQRRRAAPASSSASFTSVCPGVSPAGTPPATRWSSLPGSSGLSAARRATQSCVSPPRSHQAVHVHPDAPGCRSRAARRGRSVPAPGRPAPRARRTPRRASGTRRPSASARATRLQLLGGAAPTPPSAARRPAHEPVAASSGSSQPTGSPADQQRQPAARQHGVVAGVRCGAEARIHARRYRPDCARAAFPCRGFGRRHIGAHATRRYSARRAACRAQRLPDRPLPASLSVAHAARRRSALRVVAGDAAAGAAKVATVYIPIVYSHAVDALAPQGPHADRAVRR